MTMEELRHVQLLMASDLTQQYAHLGLGSPAEKRCFIGQPVELTPHSIPETARAGLHVLRVAASAPLVVRMWREGLDPILAEDRAVIQKLRLVLSHWPCLQTKPSNL